MELCICIVFWPLKCWGPHRFLRGTGVLGEAVRLLWSRNTYSACLFLFSPKQEEMCRIEEEQSFEELKILRELVHERFHKQEELAEVRDAL